MTQLHLSNTSPSTATGFSVYYLEFANPPADEKEAFNLLHLLHHLNGAAFDSIYTLPRLSSAIVRALCRLDHQERMGGAYRLYVRIVYLADMNQASSCLDPASENAVGSMIRARKAYVHQVWPDD